MILQKISIPIDDWDKQEEILRLTATYFYSLTNGGQIFEKKWPLMNKEANSLTIYVRTFEEKSLENQFSSKYGNQNRDELEKLINHKISFSSLGLIPDEGSFCCDCENPDFLILYTTFLKIGSPLHCGDCFGQIPLYKLGNPEGYLDILNWEEDYNSCDTLQLHCEVGEKFAMKQISKYSSSLSQLGLKMCRKITKLSQKPTYYYLYNYRKISQKKDKARKCPNCGDEWALKEPLHTLFNFKCNNCNLLSSLSSRKT